MADYPYPELIGLDTTPEELDTLRDLKAVDENAYYSGVANVLNNMILSNYAANQSGRNEGLFQKLEDLKGKSEPAYYKAQLRYLGEQLGWQHGQNTYDNTGPVQQQIQALIPEAQKAGLSADEINDVLGNSFSTASGINQQGIATRAATGGSGFNFQKDMLPGLKFVGGAALAMTGAGAALAPGAGAAGAGAGAGAIDSTAVALGGSGGGGAFIPAAGSGASFGIVPGAAYTTAGLGTSSNLGLMGPTYGELGITGVEGGYAGPTYGEMGYTGLNQSEAIAAADAASKGLTGADALNYINNAKKAYETANSLSKILNPTNATGTTNATNATSYNPQQLASLLSQPLPTQAAPGGLYRMNENPFNFGTQGQTVALPGTYDVSGTNPMANALRKA
jgi:hypothetical protein